MASSEIGDLTPALVAEIKAQGVREAADWMEYQANLQAAKYPAPYSGEHAAVRSMRGCASYLRSWALNLTTNVTKG